MDEAGQRRAELAGVEKEIKRLQEKALELRDSDERDAALALLEDANSSVAKRQNLLAGLEAKLARAEDSVESLNDLLASEIKLRKTAERLLELAEQRRAGAESAQRDALVASEEARRNNAKSAYEIVAIRKALDTERKVHEGTCVAVKELAADKAAFSERLRRASHDLAASEAKVAALQSDSAQVRRANAQVSNEMAGVRKERDVERQKHGDTHTRMRDLEAKLAVKAGQCQKAERSLADAESSIVALKGELAALRQKQ